MEEAIKDSKARYSLLHSVWYEVHVFSHFQSREAQSGSGKVRFHNWARCRRRGGSHLNRRRHQQRPRAHRPLHRTGSTGGACAWRRWIPRRMPRRMRLWIPPSTNGRWLLRTTLRVGLSRRCTSASLLTAEPHSTRSFSWSTTEEIGRRFPCSALPPGSPELLRRTPRTPSRPSLRTAYASDVLTR